MTAPKTPAPDAIAAAVKPLRRMTAQDVEVAVARHFSPRQNLIAPNVFWGIGLPYEADLVVLRDSGYAAEVEIKVSESDIKADLKKPHQHGSRLFRELWFAVPANLADSAHIPAHAGILSVNQNDKATWVKATRSPKRRRDALRWTEKQRLKLMELCCMRVWSLKEHLSSQRKRQVEARTAAHDLASVAEFLEAT